jgi:hypothetical protein
VIKDSEQSPDYPMQLMLGIYDFGGDAPGAGDRPKIFVVDHLRGYRWTG